jgi:hypothetical protein
MHGITSTATEPPCRAAAPQPFRKQLLHQNPEHTAGRGSRSGERRTTPADEGSCPQQQGAQDAAAAPGVSTGWVNTLTTTATAASFHHTVATKAPAAALCCWWAASTGPSPLLAAAVKSGTTVAALRGQPSFIKCGRSAETPVTKKNKPWPIHSRHQATPTCCLRLLIKRQQLKLRDRPA